MQLLLCKESIYLKEPKREQSIQAPELLIQDDLIQEDIFEVNSTKDALNCAMLKMLAKMSKDNVEFQNNMNLQITCSLCGQTSSCDDGPLMKISGGNPHENIELIVHEYIEANFPRICLG